MKKALLVIISALGLFPMQAVHAQGVLYISNLGQAAAGSGAVGRDSRIAQVFTTGTSPGGYVLNSVQLLMGAPMGAPSGFTVSIYSKTGDPHSEHEPGDSPNSTVGSLTGPDPTVAGTYTYTNSGIILSPSTFYFVVLTAATFTNDGSYIWNGTTGLTQSNGFRIEDQYFSSSNGSAWAWNIRTTTFKVGLHASAIPPPNLAITRDGQGNIKAAWPNLGSYSVEQTTNLQTANWTPSNHPITNNGVSNVCTVPAETENMFFRLKLQSP